MKLKHNKALKRIAAAFAIVIVAACIYINVLAPHTLEARQRLQLESTQNQLIQTREDLQNSNKSAEEKQKLNDDLNKKLEETQKELQAKRSSNTASAAVATTQPSFKASGSKEDWLRASGIPESQWGYVDYIVTRESGWNPNAINPNGGACGLGQQLPCGKWAGAWNDPVAALIAMNGYVQKYGGWAGAVAFWQLNHWY